MDWLQARLNLNTSQLRRIIERIPNFLALSIDDNLEPTINNIQSSLELSDEELTKMIVRQPDVFTYDMSAEIIKQRISLLQEILRLREDDIATLRRKCIDVPQLLFWPEEKMKGIQQWMQQRFDLGDAKIAQMCRNRPEVLYLNTTTLDDKTDLIQSDLSLSDDELSDLVSKFPSIFCMSTEENWRPKLQYLQTRFELDDNALKHLVLNAYSLVGLSEDTIEEKLQFYSNLIGEREAKRLVVKTYNLLKQSLKRRLNPRLAEVEKSGVKVRWNETLIKRLAIRSKEQWEKYKLDDAPRGRAAS
jgi:hypothetical protein